MRVTFIVFFWYKPIFKKKAPYQQVTASYTSVLLQRDAPNEVTANKGKKLKQQQFVGTLRFNLCMNETN